MRGAAGVILFQDPDGMAKASHGDPLAAAAQLFDPSSGISCPPLFSSSALIPDGYLKRIFHMATDGRPSRRFPRIPVQPIGYDSAEILLRFLVLLFSVVKVCFSSLFPPVFFYAYRALKEENEAPKDWQAGSPPDVGKYYLGPDLNPSGRKIRMTVKTITIYNAVGILRGREEPGNNLCPTFTSRPNPPTCSCVLFVRRTEIRQNELYCTY